MLPQRPKLDLPLTIRDKWLEAIGIVLFLALWAMSVAVYSTSPDIIPIHFNGKGEPDGFGSKATVFLMPGIITFVYLLLTLLSRVPHQFNYLTTITPENAADQYRRGVMILRVAKLLMLLMMLVIDWEAYFSAAHKLRAGLVITIIFIVFIPIFAVVYSTRGKKKNISKTPAP